MKAFKYFSIFVVPFFVFISFTCKGWLTYIPAIILFGLVPLIEFMIKPNKVNFNKEEEKIEKENKRVKIQIQRFKGLGEMNPKQLRETTMQPDTRRLIQLTLDNPLQVTQTMDMLLSKKRASDRKSWLEKKGDLANV